MPLGMDLGASYDKEASKTSPAPESGVLEAIMMDKMSRATNFLRSNSVHSVDSACSGHSYYSTSSFAGDSDRCACDDCVLGITDFLHDFSQTKVELNNGGGSLIEKSKARKPSGWRKLRSMVQWTPFIQTYKHKRYQWVQLAGHSGNFKAGKSQGTVLKKLCAQEEVCYRKLDNDAMVQFVPKYQGVLTLDDDEKFIQLQDCLSSFTNPSIMDCKIGVRTYLEEELAKAKEKPKLRRDMYDKMIAVDSSAPTEEEHKLKGVTKPRYMVWRETISSTATLGFRIEGVKMSDGSSSKDFKTTKTKDQVFEAFQKFLSFSPDKAVQYLERLRVIRSSLEGSKFFHEHELIGSSLLFVHDSKKASIWLIDFGKTVPLPSGVVIDHKSPWEVGNHEDGYLIGIDNLVNIMAQVVSLDRSKPEDTSVSSRHSSSSSTRPKSVTKPPVSSSS